MKIGKTGLIKWGLPLIILGVGAWFSAAMPSTVESFLPKVTTIQLTAESYTPGVRASGIIRKTEEGWTAVVSVSEQDIGYIEIGQKAQISGAAIPEGKFTTCVKEISSSARQIQSRISASQQTVVDVVLEIETDADSESELRDGYTAEAVISTGSPQQVYILPYSAICQDDDGEYVFVMKDGKAERRGIITGEELPQGARILSGLSVSDIVIERPENVKDGERVLEEVEQA